MPPFMFFSRLLAFFYLIFYNNSAGARSNGKIHYFVNLENKSLFGC